MGSSLKSTKQPIRNVSQLLNLSASHREFRILPKQKAKATQIYQEIYNQILNYDISGKGIKLLVWK